MKKLSLQAKYFIIGVVLTILGLISCTLLPLFMKSKTSFDDVNYVYFVIEFFMFNAASVFFLFCPKYFKGQIITVLAGVLYYISFVNYFLFF